MKKSFENYPKLKFIVSQKQELKTYLGFLETSKFINNQREMNLAFYQPYPELRIFKGKTLNDSERVRIVAGYIKKFYQKNYPIIERNTEIVKKDWQKIASKFYELTNGIFKGNYWPTGKYIAYPTIWGVYPRFLENKTFQFPYKHSKKGYVLVVIAHEMLHFIFYNYFIKKYSKYKSDKYNFFVWHVSEIFNTLVQNSHQWLEIFEVKSMTYPEHKKIITKLEKKYHRCVSWDVDEFIKDIMKAVKKVKL